MVDARDVVRCTVVYGRSVMMSRRTMVHVARRVMRVAVARCVGVAMRDRRRTVPSTETMATARNAVRHVPLWLSLLKQEERKEE